MRVDGELSRFEERELSRHLDLCVGCAAYARDLGGFSALLRAAPPVAPDFRVELPRRRRISVMNLQGVAAAAAVFVLAATFAFGHLSGSRTAQSFPGQRSASRPAFLDSQTYEQRLLRQARDTHERPVGGKSIPV